mgnify:CR=1 FL=1
MPHDIVGKYAECAGWRMRVKEQDEALVHRCVKQAQQVVKPAVLRHQSHQPPGQLRFSHRQVPDEDAEGTTLAQPASCGEI